MNAVIWFSAFERAPAEHHPFPPAGKKLAKIMLA
jgi:hypothetical protein